MAVHEVHAWRITRPGRTPVPLHPRGYAWQTVLGAAAEGAVDVAGVQTAFLGESVSDAREGGGQEEEKNVEKTTDNTTHAQQTRNKQKPAPTGQTGAPGGDTPTPQEGPTPPRQHSTLKRGRQAKKHEQMSDVRATIQVPGASN